MKIQINLATRPFVELRPFFLRLRILMGALAGLAVALLIWTHFVQVRVDKAQAQMDALRRQTDAFQQEKLHNEQRMRQPLNAAALNRAHFLNAVFLRKSFSWTAVMMDLETVLPTGVQVTSIEPSVTTEGDVVIRLRVSGERDRAVQLVRNLERSKRFSSPRLTGESVQAKEAIQGNGYGAAARNMAAPVGAPGGVEFEILADYVPLPEGEAYPHVKNASAEKGGAEKAAGSSRPGSVKSKPMRSGRYPPNGVVLKPYQQSGAPQAQGGRP
jgi:type IV pilus assembly protein PilN